jgi:hypothetical protein
MKLVILVIASDNLAIYAHHEACWKSYARSHPDVVVYFIRQREDVDETYIDGDTIWSRGREATERVFEKTIAAFQYLPTSSYDFLVRTNLSSVWNFRRLIDFCRTLPTTNVFCGVIGNPGISGAGMILSPDVVTKLVANSGRVDRGMWDDVDLGKVAELCGIPRTRGYHFIPTSQFEIDRWWNSRYHFYLKDMRDGVRNVANELRRMRYLIRRIYPGVR